ncbi:RNA 2'-phosphotransferase [uncultured Tenacibaculum sp.]|uniref:RNA 2'-phosphotransferase n=1 Tax=uncultured Tenacibaculum sp. TaxID=174713 RepID=UPI0026107395|nr:RNA 2'-phosphotransferase [uncultured Tenacibaculum sp.]
MNEREIKSISKFLSLLLRHQPDLIGLKLDKNGWADVAELIEKSKRKGKHFSIEKLEEVVATNDKKRFSFNEDQTKIRANQGHSLKTIDLKLEAIQPPEYLYHGTVPKFMQSIREKGLQKMSRQHVHLSQDLETATKVGSRRGVPTILTVRSGAMHVAGFEFYQSKNGVWLTDHVPANFIEFK